MPSSRAFSLIELLVVIAIIALLVSILLPALGAARKAAQGVGSLANLNQASTTMLGYTLDHKDQMLNCFSEKETPGVSDTRSWYFMPEAFGKLGIPYGADRYPNNATEPFAYSALCFLFDSFDQREGRLRQTMAAPADARLNAFYIEKNSEQGREAYELGVLSSSYWYPPTFWQNPTRFRFTTRSLPNPGNNYLIRRNKSADVTLPANKVMLFENQDFLGKTPRMFYHPSAKIHAAMVDGSAKLLDVGAIIAATPSSSPKTATELARPAGTWVQTDDEMNRLDYGPQQGFSWTYGGAAYFWATRNGIKGRDVP